MNETLIWQRAETGRLKLLSFLKTSSQFYTFPGETGEYMSPKRGALIRAAEAWPVEGLLRVWHLMEFLAVAERERELDWRLANNGGENILWEPQEKKLTASNLGLTNPSAFVRPETLDHLISRLAGAIYY